MPASLSPRTRHGATRRTGSTRWSRFWSISVSTLAYFSSATGVAYGVHFFTGAETLAQRNGYDLVKFFFLLTFAAAIPPSFPAALPSVRRLNRN